MVIENRKTKLLIYDVIFKAVFKKEQEILLKMVKDIFDIDDDVELAAKSEDARERFFKEFGLDI